MPMSQNPGTTEVIFLPPGSGRSYQPGPMRAIFKAERGRDRRSLLRLGMVAGVRRLRTGPAPWRKPAGSAGNAGVCQQWELAASLRILRRDLRRVRSWSVSSSFWAVIVAFSRLEIRMNARREALGLGNALQQRDELRAL